MDETEIVAKKLEELIEHKGLWGYSHIDYMELKYRDFNDEVFENLLNDIANKYNLVMTALIDIRNILTVSWAPRSNG